MAPELWGVLGAASHLAALAGAYVAFYAVLWLFYAACMAWDRQAHTPEGLTRPARVVSGFWFAVGFALDGVGNVLLTAPFLELPHELTITARITRHAERGEGRRQRLALWIRQTWLDGLDRNGIHRA